MTEPTQPHDKLFKGLLDQPGTAGVLLRERVPPEIASLLADNPPELIDGEFIDEALQGSQSDRLFRARLKDGGDALLYVLIDHKSSPEPGIILQLLGYMLRIWVRHAGGKAEALRSQPAILPMVVYHGASEWKVSLSLPSVMTSRPLSSKFPRPPQEAPPRPPRPLLGGLSSSGGQRTHEIDAVIGPIPTLNIRR